MGTSVIRRGASGAALTLALALGLTAPSFAQDHGQSAMPSAGSTSADPKPAAGNVPNLAGETIKPQAGEQATDAKATEAANGSEAEVPPSLSWSFGGIFGHYDTAQLQRGYQVYKEVCSNCHSMKLVAFRNLAALGYTDGQIKALAATYQVDDGPNDKGEMYKRPGRPSDYFPSPFPNPEAAAAAYGKAPPDMSDLAKARGWERGFPTFIFDFFTQSEETEGPSYISAVLQGYTKPDDPKYNVYMPNHKIAMPKPLSDGQVEYADGTAKTLPQYSKDVAAFLMWAAEPKLEQRKAMGLRVTIFFIVFAVLLYFVKKRIWARVGGDVIIGAHDVSDKRDH